jgi:AI-2 transport protein TqsA
MADSTSPVGTDAPPNASAGWTVRTTCLVLIAVVAAGAALSALREVVTPLLIAVLLFFLFKPVDEFVARRGVSRWVAYPLLFLVLLAALLALGLLVQSNARAFEAKLPAYQERMGSLLERADRMTGGNLQSLGNLLEASSANLAHFAFGAGAGVLEGVLMVLFYLFFLVMEVKKLPSRLRKALPPASAEWALRVGRDVDTGVRRYLAVKTGVSLGLGAATGLMGWAFGLDFWFLWAALMFLANYVTYIGSAVACVPPVALAYLQLSSPLAATALAVLIVLNRVFWIDYVEVVLSGKRLNVSPLLLLFAIMGLGLLWGVTGMVVAVPLVMAIKIVLLNVEGAWPLGVLMGEE